MLLADADETQIDSFYRIWHSGHIVSKLQLGLSTSGAGRTATRAMLLEALCKFRAPQLVAACERACADLSHARR